VGPSAGLDAAGANRGASVPVGNRTKGTHCCRLVHARGFVSQVCFECGRGAGKLKLFLKFISPQPARHLRCEWLHTSGALLAKHYAKPSARGRLQIMQISRGKQDRQDDREFVLTLECNFYLVFPFADINKRESSVTWVCERDIWSVAWNGLTPVT
jgi:hypothetical protein